MDNYVLVVDDESHIRRILSLQLKKAGLEVECAADGQEALDAVAERIPDLVITDFQMPRMDGLDLCAALRDRSETARVPVLLLTAKGFELTDDEVGEQFNVVGMICKPFSPDDLLSKVESVLSLGESS
jgi:CheY-like chemotaxis protein